MSRTIEINPITRIEGHGKVTIHLDERGVVEDAKFHVTQYRGFEKLCEGRPFFEMPSLMARICGICPVSHLIASAKACDEILAVRIPPTAEKLRRILNLAQILQSHALNFFHLSSPDLLLGMDADPRKRNIFALIESNPDLALEGIKLRKIGQQIIEWFGGKRIHPSWVVPGGVNEPLTEERRQQILAVLPEARPIVRRTLDWFKASMDKYQREIGTFANFPSLFLGLVNPKGQLDHYDGNLRFVDSAGNVIAPGIDPRKYWDAIGEAVEPWSYMKFPYYKPMGYPGGMYRVGPLARLNVIDEIPSPEAHKEWVEYRERENGAVLSSFHYHYARLIEMLFCVERIEQWLNDPAILSRHVRAFARPNAEEGIGITEAPRGTLIHHYKVDERGLITTANLIVATGHNNLAMNRGVLQVARNFIDGNKIQEGMLNRVEAVIRAFDPCLSCSTHAAGQMPLHIQLLDPEGHVLDQVRRDS